MPKNWVVALLYVSLLWIVTESASSQIPGLWMAEIVLHVRARCRAHSRLLSSCGQHSVVQRREGDPTWQQYDEAWEKAAALEERVIAYLEQVAAEKGFAVRTAGVIDMGETRPLRATWKSDPTLAGRD